MKILASIEEAYVIDVFCYSSRPNTESPNFIVGVQPVKQLIVNGNTSREELHVFAFQDLYPTLGFLSYEYGLRQNHVSTDKVTSFPLGCLKKYQGYIKYDAEAQEVLWFSGDGGFESILAGFFDKISCIEPCIYIQGHGNIRASLSQEAYVDAVRKVLEYIKAGDTYQLNLSIAFDCEAGISSLLGFFSQLLKQYPAKHYSYFNIDNYTILSTSPETFLTVHDREVISLPIKGTAKIDSSPLSQQIEKLRQTPKEVAELSMIVDLIRNDIAKHCDYGSVQVKGHQSVFQVDDLLQMYTYVCGQLKQSSTVLDLLVDAFPGGSITGFPKERSMAIIDSLEPHARTIYCGSLFALWNETHIDASIAIRTAYYDHQANHFHWFAGSGITALSNAEAEYHETLAKGAKFECLFKGESAIC